MQSPSCCPWEGMVVLIVRKQHGTQTSGGKSKSMVYFTWRLQVLCVGSGVSGLCTHKRFFLIGSLLWSRARVEETLIVGPIQLATSSCNWLDHSHRCLFTYSVATFTPKSSSCHRDRMTRSFQSIYYMTFCIRKCANSWSSVCWGEETWGF